MSKTKDKPAEADVAEALGVEEAPPAQLPASAATAVPAVAADSGGYGSDAGLGFDNVGADELLIPFFRILQSNSPQVDPQSGRAVEGAAAGMVINTATNELIVDASSKGFEVLCVLREHMYAEYVDRDHGGGFVGVMDADSPIVAQLQNEQGENGRPKKFGKLRRGADHEVIESFLVYAILPRGEGGSRGVIPFQSTQIKLYKSLAHRIVELQAAFPAGPRRPPSWAFRWLFKTVPMRNKKGSFWGWHIKLVAPEQATYLLPAASPFIKMGSGFYGLYHDGGARADFEKGNLAEEEPDDPGTTSAAHAGSAAPADLDDEIPF